MSKQIKWIRLEEDGPLVLHASDNAGMTWTPHYQLPKALQHTDKSVLGTSTTSGYMTSLHLKDMGYVLVKSDN